MQLCFTGLPVVSASRVWMDQKLRIQSYHYDEADDEADADADAAIPARGYWMDQKLRI